MTYRMDMSSREIACDFFSPDPGRRLKILTMVVLDLMMEVEALREAAGSGSVYRDAYRNAALLTHHNAGLSEGWEKVVDRFYPEEEATEGRTWRELLMMRRLGFTPPEIESYQRKALEMEMYS